MRRVRIQAGDVAATAVFLENRTAAALWEALPLEGTVSTWGDEIYFPTPLALPPEEPQAVVSAGDLAYWPVGRAFCIFWGPTPASVGHEIRPASPVNLVGRLEGDVKVFDRVQEGVPIRIERIEEGV